MVCCEKLKRCIQKLTWNIQNNCVYVCVLFSSQVGDYSDQSCKLSKWFGLTTVVCAYYETCLFIFDRFLAVRNVDLYRERFMYNLRYPVLVTVANYLCILFLLSCLYYAIDYNEESGLCELHQSIATSFGKLFFVMAFIVVLATVLPLIIGILCSG